MPAVALLAEECQRLGVEGCRPLQVALVIGDVPQVFSACAMPRRLSTWRQSARLSA